MEKAICFGAAGGGKRLFDEISEKYEIIAFTDNDKDKIGTSINGIKTYGIEECFQLEWDVVVITSAPGMMNIKQQLISMGIDSRKIDTTFIELPLLSRVSFLEKLSQIQNFDNAAVAEVGFFEGDFAKWINQFYAKQKLHLFDTFEGFDKRDIDKDSLYSEAKVGDYSNASIDMVMKKMIYPENVIIHKGYFPDTAKQLEEERFAFVNLDVDLYEPTYNGLKFFKDKMISGGVILVHDYFATNFKGPHEAVNQFLEEMNGRYAKYPIGDGISIMITGF